MILHLALFGTAFLLAKQLGAGRRAYLLICVIAAVLLMVRWALPDGAPYALDAGDSISFLGWTLVVAVPIAEYAFLIRTLRRRSGVQDDGIRGSGAAPARRGLVIISDDAALREDTLVEMGRVPARDDRGSFAWRGEDGEIAAHLAWRLQGSSLQIDLFYVQPDCPDAGVAKKLVEAAEEHARELRLNKIVTKMGDGRIAVDMDDLSFRQVARLDLGGGVEWSWMEKGVG